MSTSFDPIHTPLIARGFNLVEASAGSGKTFSIAFIAMRLIVEKAVPLEKILITTFTRLAAAEMTERIFSMLKKADALYLKATPPKGDDLVEQWVANHWNDEFRFRITSGLTQFNKLAIQTNDSLFQKLTSQQALELNAPIEAGEQIDERTIFYRQLRTFWLEALSDCSKTLKPRFLNRFPLPENLNRFIKAEHLRGVKIPSVALKKELTKFTDAIDAVESLAQTKMAQFINIFDDALKDGCIKKPSIGGVHWSLGLLKESPVDAILSLENDLENYFMSKVPVNCKDKICSKLQTFEPLFYACNKLAAQEGKYFQAFLYHAQTLVNQRTLAEIEAHSGWSYDSILYQLEASVLKGAVHGTFDAVLVDEFQDTNHAQWNVLCSLLSDTGFGYLIGDPKQAIYRFRKADLNTYFSAAQVCKNRYTLDFNWRSTPILVNAVNCLFNRENVFLEEKMYFSPAQTALAEADNSVAQFVTLDSTNETDTAQACVNKIHDVIKDGFFPNQIMVLVNTNAQAEMIEHLLLDDGVPATIRKMSKDTNFLVNCVKYFVEALKKPQDEALQKRYLLAFLNLDINTALNHPNISETLQSLRDKWFYIGPLGILKHIVLNSKIRSNWQEVGQKSAFSGLLLVMEKLQEFWSEYPSFKYVDAIVEEWEYAIEKESIVLTELPNAVRILTTFTSKGLESDVVLCPFILTKESIYKNDHLNLLKEGGFQLVYGSDYEDCQIQKEAHFEAELRRFLYVALTRASKQLFVFANKKLCVLRRMLYSPVKSNKSSEQKKELFTKLQLDAEQLGWTVSEGDYLSKKSKQEDENQEVRVDTLSRRRALIGISSFSRLLKQKSVIEMVEDRLGEVEESHTDYTEIKLTPGAASGETVHQCLQKLLENRALQEEVSQTQSLHPFWADQLKAQGLSDEASEELYVCVMAALNNKIEPLGNKTLGHFQTSAIQCEMKFNMHLKHSLEVAMLNDLLKKHAHLKKQWMLSEMPKQVIPSGMFTGFIDLTLCNDERYWIIDYKSNYLENYSPANIQQAMEKHGYGWQASFYMLALHRYLSRLLPNYSLYDQLGGALYLFVRGMVDPSSTQNGVCQLGPSLEWIEILDEIIE